MTDLETHDSVTQLVRNSVTDREWAVLALYCDLGNRKLVARKTGLAPATVERHLSNVRLRCGAPLHVIVQIVTPAVVSREALAAKLRPGGQRRRKCERRAGGRTQRIEWTPDLIRTLLVQRDSGASWDAIAYHMGMARSTVRRKALDLGVPNGSRDPRAPPQPVPREVLERALSW